MKNGSVGQKMSDAINTVKINITIFNIDSDINDNVNN